MEHCRVTWSEAWEMPIVYRRWMIDRKSRHNREIEEARKKASKPPGK